MMNILNSKVPESKRLATVERKLTPEDISIEINRPVRFVLRLISSKRLRAIKVSPKTYCIEPAEWDRFKKERVTS